MGRALLTPLAVLLYLKLFLVFPYILAGMIIYPLAGGALQLYEILHYL
jgi:hypothetical protein